MYALFLPMGKKKQGIAILRYPEHTTDTATQYRKYGYTNERVQQAAACFLLHANCYFTKVQTMVLQPRQPQYVD